MGRSEAGTNELEAWAERSRMRSHPRSASSHPRSSGPTSPGGASAPAEAPEPPPEAGGTVPLDLTRALGVIRAEYRAAGMAEERAAASAARTLERLLEDPPSARRFVTTLADSPA